MTVDETWIDHYTPEMKEQSKQWSSPSEHAPKKATTVPSTRKVMANVFWHSQGIIFTEYLEKARNITGQYYDDLDFLLPFADDKLSSIFKSWNAQWFGINFN